MTSWSIILWWHVFDVFGLGCSLFAVGIYIILSVVLSNWVAHLLGSHEADISTENESPIEWAKSKFRCLWKIFNEIPLTSAASLVL